MNRFYVTTPIYYVNDKPHLGSAYTTVIADVLTRYHRLFGEEAYFLTGTDEHGQKVEQAAKARGKNPQEHCDEFAQVFVNAWSMLNVKYDQFFRTTSEFHNKAVQEVLQELYDRGEIYSDTYEGWYNVSDETFHTEKELVNGKAPNGKEVVKISEKNYFFRMSKYQQKLIDYINQNPQFIQPESRRNEVLGFLRQPLNDLCISRPKSRLKWGIEIPFDRDYVTYVWFDALLNYATAVGYKQKGREEEFKKWWQETGVVHLIGKDILTTHTVYWPTMLMAMGIPLPKTIYAHGWILNKDNEKMSKSKGSVMDPNHFVRDIGEDALRYFLVHDIPFGHDAPASHELIYGRVNTDLANNLGNLLSRTTNLITKFFEGKAPAAPAAPDLPTTTLIALAKSTGARVKDSILDFQPHKAIDHVLHLLNDTNKYLEEKAPWKMAKTDLNAAGETLYVALEVLRLSAYLLSPVMPGKMTKLLEIVGGSLNLPFEKAIQWGTTQPGTNVQKAEPLFPRIEITE